MTKLQIVRAELARYPGQWVAWDRAEKRLLAVADSFGEVMAKVEDLDVEDLVVEAMPGVNPNFVPPPFTLIEWESPDILVDIRTMVPDWERWLDTPNVWFAARCPRELIGTVDEQEIRYMLRRVRMGAFT